MMSRLFELRATPETRSLSLALVFYLLAIFTDVWVGAWADVLPDRFLFSGLLGLAILFQTDALTRWQMRDAQGWTEPRHAQVFGMTLIGGGAVLGSAAVWPDFLANAIVTPAVTFGAAVLVPGLTGRLLGAQGDERYRQSQLRAREAGLRALTVFGAIFVVIDMSGLVAIPLWLGICLLLWAVGSTVTGVMWWLERDGGEI